VLRSALRSALPILVFALFPAASALAGNGGLSDLLTRAAPGANPNVIKLAVSATQCAIQRGLPASQRLAVIDYSRPSTQPRMWVFDLLSGKLLYQELVAHGRNSGDNIANAFSNEPGSLESSLGLFRTLDPYTGHNGYSLRMNGLEPGFNDNAFERAIVIHGAPYVNTSLAMSQGRLGRSWGCPAVRPAVAPKLIETLKGGQFVFAYFPDRRWLSSSSFLHCGGTQIADAR